MGNVEAECAPLGKAWRFLEKGGLLNAEMMFMVLLIMIMKMVMVMMLMLIMRLKMAP